MIQSMLFFPEKEFLEQPADYGLCVEDVYPITADHVKLHGWYFEAPKTKAVLLFLHGNAGNIAGRIHKVKGWLEHGVSVLLLDYRGYGQSQGQIQQGEDIVMDAKAGYDWLIRTKRWSADKIIVCGESLGSHPATRLAVDFETAGLILEAPFTAFTDLAAIHYPALPKLAVQTLLKDFRFDNLSLISKVKAPVFIMHGTLDATCPFLMGKKLFEEAPEPKQFLKIPDAGHNNLPESAGEPYWDGPYEFLFKHSQQ